MINPYTSDFDTHLPWGHRYCPNCLSPFAVKPQSVRFIARYEGDAVFFMLCSKCTNRYDQLSQKNKEVFQLDCMQRARSGSIPPNLWACTTYLALNMNLGDYTNAVEYGIHSMDRKSYEELIRTNNACIVLNGLSIMWQPMPQNPQKSLNNKQFC